jgi:DNA-binding beta-propeller fold protein YncE
MHEDITTIKSGGIVNTNVTGVPFIKINSNLRKIPQYNYIFETNYITRGNTEVVVATITLAGGNGAYAATVDSKHKMIWATNYDSNKVYKINPVTNIIEATVTLVAGGNARNICFDGNYVWVCNYGVSYLTKINTNTNTIDSHVTLTTTTPYGIFFDGDYIWSCEFTRVSKINPSTNAIITTFSLSTNSYNGCFDGYYIWVANFSQN